MVKKIRFQEMRTQRRRHRGDDKGAWIFGPLDYALISAMVVAALWLQWISNGISHPN